LLYDLAILGAGPAGLSAAIYAARKLLKICVVSHDVGGQILLTSDIENYLGFELISAPELVRKFQEQVNIFGFEQFLGEKVSKLEKFNDHFLVTASQAVKIESKSLLIASGKRSRLMNVPGEREFAAKGISYCSTCDAPFFKDLPVAVIGGGNSAFEAVIDLLKICPQVYMINITPSWQGDEIYQQQALKNPKLVPMLNTGVKEVRGGDRVQSIVVKTPEGEQELKVRGVFVEIGLAPNSEFAKGFVEMNKYGEIIIDCDCRTNVPGVFAAGDVTTVTEKQIVVAAGEGAKAALAAYRWLIMNRKL
jgi:alkyl hydroperoxide reductase subunit F